ncbi:uncharacterized protein E5676_scaffold169G001000 [Cucumis melo var. makuwa]|uniref:Uncharacterized protein n=1 Tax=Cucumis melo var. makuwa TaxID=1194695 RepID=A0A5A7TCJ6_CUCMM|nr:uncharacterized protein E6C27_scaffold64G001020 [Cucumis melo var. makuwa]TYK00491.1 uncharacterized protein E5676_scaffold169G001000 [Cucumis melo var. makuwa]
MHAINATEEESIPLRSLEEERVSKELSKFNVDDLLSLPQETKTILINALLNSAASSSSAPTTTYESTPYCMSIDFSDEDLLLGSKLHNRPLWTKDGFDPKAYKLMAKAGYDFTTHTEFKSLKIHEQSKLSSTQKKLLWEGHVIPMSRKGLGYKSPEPIRITRKEKEKVVDNNHITVKEVDSMEEKEGDSQRTSAFNRISPHVAHAPVFERLSMTETSMTTKPSAFERLSITKKKNAQTPRALIINRLGDGGPHVQTNSSIDTKKKESTSRASVWCRIKHIDVESCHGKEFPCEELEIETPEEDAEDVPQSLEDGGQSTVDELKEVNLGTIEEPRPTFISVSLSSEEDGKYMSLLTEYKDIFAWSYKEMPRLDPKVAVHHLAIKPGYQPIKQAQRRFRPELIPHIKVEVNKLIEAGFIREVKYLTWIANIVPVRKKNGQLRVCVDFHDLNNVCPKDDFPLPITEIMVDATTGHEARYPLWMGRLDIIKYEWPF